MPPDGRDPEAQRLLRSLPAIHELVEGDAWRHRFAAEPRPRALALARLAVERARRRILGGDLRPFDAGDLDAAFASLAVPNLRPVFNATGVILHTNLGRAPLSAAALERVQRVASGYCNLEFDLEEGERGSRYDPVVELLTGLTGAEDAIVVNNCAAAVLLVLTAMAQGREVIVSRGELVEIGGGFRIPDVMRQSGARLVEVGTTNRTRRADYVKALAPETALLAKIHRSNFALVGFTEETPAGELVKLGRERGVPVFVDLGSGNLEPLVGAGLTAEATVREVVDAGVDLVSFSGDKLLGGPQAGVIVGRREWIAKVREHPLNRALRIDKMTVAALEATLQDYRDGRSDQVPTRRMLTEGRETLRARAERLRELLREQGVEAAIEETIAQVGGGSMPLSRPPSYACALRVDDPDGLQERLRQTDTPVIGRVSQGQLLLDVRCLREEDLGSVAVLVGGAR